MSIKNKLTNIWKVNNDIYYKAIIKITSINIRNVDRHYIKMKSTYDVGTFLIEQKID